MSTAQADLPSSIDRARAQRLIAAIRASWSADTAVEPERWSPDRPSTGQCEVSSLRFWDEFGGDMVLWEVLVDDEHSEYHWTNRFGGDDPVDVDLTAEQFHGHEELRQLQVFSHDTLVSNRAGLRPDVLARAARFRAEVADRPGPRPA